VISKNPITLLSFEDDSSDSLFLEESLPCVHENLRNLFSKRVDQCPLSFFK